MFLKLYAKTEMPDIFTNSTMTTQYSVRRRQPADLNLLAILVCGIIILPLLIAVASLCVFQLSLVFSNQTTLEHLEQERRERRKARQKSRRRRAKLNNTTASEEMSTDNTNNNDNNDQDDDDDDSNWNYHLGWRRNWTALMGNNVFVNNF